MSVKPHGKRLVYLDNAATTQKPIEVIKAMDKYYEELNANVYRSPHYLSVLSTQAYEEARERVKKIYKRKKRRVYSFHKKYNRVYKLYSLHLGYEAYKRRRRNTTYHS